MIPVCGTCNTEFGFYKKLWAEALRPDRPEEILASSLFSGFSYADIPHMGYAVLVYADGDESIARTEAKRLADSAWEGANQTLADELLAPSVIYAPAVVAPLAAHEVHAVAHVTGGGLPGNLPRVLGDAVDAVVDPTTWEVPRIFRELQAMGGVDDDEMARVFNMGVGMVLAVPASGVDDVVATLATHDRSAWVVGELVPGSGTMTYREVAGA